MKKLWFLPLFLALACSSPNVNEENSRKSIVCTTGIIADVVDNLIGDSADVIALMGPGVDPHLYKASQGDVSKLSNADVIIYNGLHLEGKMTDILGKMAQSRSVIKISDGVPEDKLLSSSDYPGTYDPHIWFDISIWNEASDFVAEKLAQEFPEWKEMIEANSAQWHEDLNKLDEWCTREISSIPDSQRVLVTAHDAFKYFGHRYQIEVRGLQGISTAAEYGLRDISEMVTFITNQKINAIFIETSVPKRAVQAVVEGCAERGHELKIGGELFSDALGEEDSSAGDYQGMVRHNVETIVGSLKGTAQ
ncbi:metal ABC transporter solute-binding protein, Zn/Mn family [Halocola ammonii]